MKTNIFSLFFNITALIIICKLPFSLNDSTPIYKVHRIIITDSVNNFNKPYNSRLDIESIGYGLIFNYTSNISLIPDILFETIFKFYNNYPDIYARKERLDDGVKEIIIHANYQYMFETIHFIFKNFGISIPLNYYFIKKEEEQKFGLRFLTRDGQEYISFGKDLIDLMKIEIKDEYSFIVNNDEFLSKMDE